MFSRWPRIWRRSEELECLCTPSSRCSTRPATWSRCTTGELDTQRINEKEETIANAAVVPHDSLEPRCWSCAPGATGLSTDIVQPTLFVRVHNVYLTCATLDRRSMARGTDATIPPPFATAVKSRVIYEAPRAVVPVPCSACSSTLTFSSKRKVHNRAPHQNLSPPSSCPCVLLPPSSETPPTNHDHSIPACSGAWWASPSTCTGLTSSTSSWTTRATASAPTSASTAPTSPPATWASSRRP